MMKENTTELSEKEIRMIVREEIMEYLRPIMKDVADIKRGQERIERLLLGEEGCNDDETLKAKANFAYLYAKRNTDLGIIDRATPALRWFEDMAVREQGEKESKLESLGKLITFYVNIRWFLALMGVTTAINAIPILTSIVKWLETILVK